MAENKKSFLLYVDTIYTVRKLTDDQAGQLFKHILAYVNDENPITDNIIIDITFEPIKQQLKRDLKKYEAIKIKRSEAGKASAEKKQENKQMLTCVESVQQTLTNSTVNVNDNVNDNDNINTFQEKPEKEPKIDFIDLIISSFSEQFLKYRQVDYFIPNKKIERSMAGKLLKAYKQNTKNSGKTSEQTISELNDFFEKCMLITEPWINQNMSLPIVISKFNQIINILRNGNKQRKNEPATSNIDILTSIAREFSNEKGK